MNTTNDLKIYDLVNGDSYRLYELCKENDWTTAEDYDEWLENGGELDFFEGDPDMIKLDGEVGYFSKIGNEIFFYLDDWSGRAASILRDFFTGCTRKHYGYYTWDQPRRVAPEWCQNLDAWEQMQNGIAYRGGCGYSYDIFPLRQAA